MGDPRGFLKIERCAPTVRPVAERVRDSREVVVPPSADVLKGQASRCMDCGVPFCHSGCPLGNLVPEWNEHVYRGRMDAALAALHATNNFPEVTGRVCPAPCEAACVLNIEGAPVTIKAVEMMVAAHALDRGLVPRLASSPTGKRVAVVGSGPAGLAAAQQLARAGHDVVVYERDDRIGGLLRYGIPDFKLDKAVLSRRLAQMTAEGVRFEAGVHVGVHLSGDELTRSFDAVVLCAGARVPRDLDVSGRELAGVHFAMDFLTQYNRRVAGDIVARHEAIVARDKRVVVIGGGDTGADCVGTAHRQGATHVVQLEILPKPPENRRADNPWPEWPRVLSSSTSHAEGCVREFAVMTTALQGRDQRVSALQGVRVEQRDGTFVPVSGTELTVAADLVLLAMGFSGVEREGVVSQWGLDLTERGTVRTAADGSTNVPGVFAAGDVSRGQSLVVWAIADGRRVAEGVDRFLRAAPS